MTSIIESNLYFKFSVPSLPVYIYRVDGSTLPIAYL